MSINPTEGHHETHISGPSFHEIEFQVWYLSVSLPVGELTKFRDNCIVWDGHHRISVARYMGAEFIDARVRTIG